MQKLKLNSVIIMFILIINSCSKSSTEPNVSEPKITTNTVTTTGLNFVPNILECTVGDTIFFNLGSTHNAIEVSEENYNQNNPIPLENGFQFDFGVSSYIIANEVKTYYYVCEPHLPQMKARIIVE